MFNLILLAAVCVSLSMPVALSDALALEEGGNQDYTIKLFPGLDHLFMKSPSGGITSDYADFRRRLCPDFLEFLESWL